MFHIPYCLYLVSTDNNGETDQYVSIIITVESKMTTRLASEGTCSMFSRPIGGRAGSTPWHHLTDFPSTAESS